ncbi:cAMP responsive element binding protein 3-like 3 like [Brachyhypopomus gauderio]|uniref:cAMP responsive element binding protein 3-like 3 like n=1 Tax=Brachyhypopomus gauderio TaxID=698409 RepID=UPI0040429CC5
MSLTDDLPDVDSADLLGLLFQDPRNNDLFFSDGNDLIEDLLSQQDMLGDMTTEDFLSSLLGEDDQGMSALCPSHSPLGSDSGISEDTTPPHCQSPQSETDSTHSPSPVGVVEGMVEGVVECLEAQVVQTDHCYSLQQDSFALQSVRAEQPDADVFIDLDELEENMSDDLSSELPCSLTIEESALGSTAEQQFQLRELLLTEEERRLLVKEGVSIPTHMPLTKAEERTLKRVRRKIRNKQSAQESRKKKKVYVDGLESRVAACTAHNQELQKKVHMLQKQNMSLIEQLKKLQSIVKMSTLKSSTTSTCVMVFLLSFCLIIFPSVNPFGSTSQKDVYTSSTVMPRALRSYPALPAPDVSASPSKDAVDVATVENNQILMTGGQNHTPDYQRVEQSDSESGVNSNSSADFPSGSQPEVPPAGPLAEEHSSAAAPPVAYDGQSKAKDSWMGQKPTSIIIQQHRSDEM